MNLLINDFLKYMQNRNMSPHTIRSYKVDLLEFSEFLKTNYGVEHPSRVNVDHIRNFVASLVRHGYEKRSINRKLSAIRSFYRYLNRHGIVDIQPATAVRSFKLPRKLPTFLTEAEMERLFELTDLSLRDRTILELLYGTGIRASELCNLKLHDIDWEREIIRVHGKGGKQREIPLTRTALRWLREYVQTGDKIKMDELGLFLSRKGTPITTRTLQRIVKKHLMKVSHKTGISPHTLRHTYATHLLNRGCDLRTVQLLLGHRSIASTQIYTHLTLKELKKIHEITHPRG